MDAKIKKKFPYIWSILEKLPSSYNLEQKIVIALYALKEDVVKEFLMYIYPFDISNEFKTTKRKAANGF